MSISSDATSFQPPETVGHGTDDARSSDTSAVNEDRSLSAEAAASNIQKAIESTKPRRPVLSDRGRDLALVAAAGFIGFVISGLVAR